MQFVKGKWATGERTVLERFPDLITVRVMGEGFTWDTQDRQRDLTAARKAWEAAQEFLADPSYRLVVLDELNIVLRYDYLDLDARACGARRARSGPARCGHRPQREAGAHRDGRPRDRG